MWVLRDGSRTIPDTALNYTGYPNPNPNPITLYHTLTLTLEYGLWVCRDIVWLPLVMYIYCCKTAVICTMYICDCVSASLNASTFNNHKTTLTCKVKLRLNFLKQYYS